MRKPLLLGVDEINRASVVALGRRQGVEFEETASVQAAVEQHGDARLIVLAGNMLRALAAYGRPQPWGHLVLVLSPVCGDALSDDDWRLVYELGVEAIVPLPYGRRVLVDLLAPYAS